MPTLFMILRCFEIFDWVDDIFIDLKHTNDRVHQKLTGVSNQKIIANIIRLDELGRGLIIRIPLIKNLTDTTENIDGIVSVCVRLENLIEVELLPYHNLGAGKYLGLDLPFDASMTAPERETIQLILEQLHAHGLKAKSANSVGCQS